MKENSWRVCLLAGVMAIVGCAGTVRAGGNTTVLADSAMVVRFSDQGLSSEALNVQRRADGLAGTASGQPVTMTWDESSVEGKYRDLPVALTVTHEEGSTIAQGELDGHAAAFRFSPSTLEGFISECAFKTEKQADGSYAGARSCGTGAAQRMVVTLPARLWERTEPERAAWIALLLSEYRKVEDGERSIAGAAAVMSAQSVQRQPRKSGLRAAMYQ